MELVDVLDDLSYRSSRAAQLAALEHIHGLLADVCVRPHDSHQRPRFFQQQNDFETNIVSRILNSGILSAATVSRIVDDIRAKASTSSTVADITSLALSALQGMALIHARSKAHLGRRLGIQSLLDLLTALRHASVNPDDPDTTVTSAVDPSDSRLAILLSPLLCSVIDTLLCLLVDSPLALRVFEECNGLEVIVRTLKKVTGQSVRMKCLEFLYFYLQDEDVIAVTGASVINLPVLPKPDPSSLAAQPTPKPARASKSSALKNRDQSSPSSNHALQTPRRPKTKQTPTTETRPRTRPPMERTVSGDSAFSVSSSRSDATDASAGPENTRMNGRDPEMRSVSRSSTCSAASTISNVTDSSVKSEVKPWEIGREAKRPFPRSSIMPSLSYSSSTVSSTATNQTLDPTQQSDKYLRINPQTPSQTRPTTPNSITQECFVPLPESPAKAGSQDVQETPKPKRRVRDEETPGVKVRDRKVKETPRAKTRDDRVGESGSNGLPASARIFPALGANLSEDNSSNPFKNSAYGAGAPRTRPAAPTLVTLSLLKGEVDYEPESPKKHTPSRHIDDEADGTIKARNKTPSDASSKQVRDSTSNPFKAPTPKPSKDALSDSKESPSPEKPARRRPRVSEILPRPIPSRPVPRNVSTPVGNMPSTPVSSRVIENATRASGVEASPISPTDTTALGVSTPVRSKKVAIIAGGARVPGRSEGGGNELRKSMAVGAKELKKSQPSSDGLRRSQGSSEGLRQSHLSTEGLRRNQPSSEALRKSPEATHKIQSSQSDTKQDTPQSSKKSAPSTPISSRSDGARRIMRDGVSRVKRDGIESEGRSSGEMERLGSDAGKRSSMEESPSRTRGVPTDGKVIRTSAEKKELLGAWLGNVDALVEGVQRAGVWGLR